MLACAAALSACGARGFSIEDAAPDHSIITGSVSPRKVAPPDPAVLSDEVTIRNAVSSAIVDEIDEGGIGWQNVGTGSRGAVHSVSETREQGYLCRRFTASRESFEGVHMYRGTTCVGQAGQWMMQAFDRVE
jgi:hypothetical protein